MLNKSHFLVLLLCISIPKLSYSQKDTTPFRSDVYSFIKGHLHESYIDLNVLLNPFILQLSDTSFTFERAVVCWDNPDGQISCAPVSLPTVDLSKYDSVIQPQAKSLVTIDNIRVKKEGRRYFIAPFYFYLVSGHELPQIYDTLAKTRAFIPGYEHEFKLPRSLLESEFTVQLYDTSYQLLSFIVSIDLPHKDEPLSFYFTGNKIDHSVAGYLSAIRQMTIRCTLGIESIFVRRNGKVYRVPDRSFTVMQ